MRASEFIADAAWQTKEKPLAQWLFLISLFRVTNSGVFNGTFPVDNVWFGSRWGTQRTGVFERWRVNVQSFYKGRHAASESFNQFATTYLKTRVRADA